MVGLLAATLPLAACQMAAPDAKTEGATPDVVSLNPCADAILVEIAEPEQILALSHYSRDPRSSSINAETARSFAANGGTIEEVMALSPDRVISGSFIAPASEKALRDFGVPLDKLGSVNSVADSFVQIEHLSTTLGRPDQGLALIADIKAALDRTSANEGERRVATVLWQPGEIVAGNHTLIVELMERAGFSNHSAAMGLGQADRISLEQLLANPPELILIAGDSAGQKHRLLSELKDSRVELFDPKLLYCGGPTIIAAMKRLAEIRGVIR